MGNVATQSCRSRGFRVKRAALLFLVRILLPAALTLLGAELFYRHRDPAKIRSGWKTVYELEGVDRKDEYVNALGYRGKSIDIGKDDLVVVLVGDSQVECRACADGRLPEDFLQNSLVSRGRQVKVFSLGSAGFGPDQELLALRTYFKRGFRADIVVVWQTLGNDVWEAQFPTRNTLSPFGHLKPTFRLDANGKLIEPETDIGDFFCTFYLVCLMRQRMYGSIDAYWERYLPPPADAVDAPDANLPVVDSEELVEREKTHWSVFMEPASPRKVYGMRLARALYAAMMDLASANGARFLIFEVNRYTEEGLADSRTNQIPSVDPRYVRHEGKLYAIGGRQAYFSTSREVNRDLPFVMIDLDRPGLVVSVENAHLNDRGNERVMDQLAAELARRGWVRR
jgi:hypothetical protein